ncbi:MAG: hypothetical protein WA210_17090 [Burkholderiaceae bacterium]
MRLRMAQAPALRLAIGAPDSLDADPNDAQAESEAQRSRLLPIGLLKCGCNIVAVLPADVCPHFSP